MWRPLFIPNRLFPIFIPLLFISSCTIPFVDRSAGYPQLNGVEWKKKNVIIVLGMKTERKGKTIVLPKLAELRVSEALRLYQDCQITGKICLILASGGDPANHGITESELMARELVKARVPEKHILLETKSVSTFHNAKHSSEILANVAPDLTVLVTSDAHIRRALKMFKIFGAFPLPAPAMHLDEQLPKR